MKFTKKYILNTIIIGFSFVLMKSFNLMLPYFLDAESYNSFNKVFYYASLISTIGVLGFTYAITQINLNKLLIVLLVFCNIIIGFIIVHSFSGIDVSLFNIFNILIISFSTILFNIYNFQLLFTSKTIKYFLTVVILSFAHYLGLGLSIYLKADLIFLFGLTSIGGVAFSFYFFERGAVSNYKQIGKFYKIGLSTFIINSSAGMILMADKFFANNIFEIEVANAYTFAWAIVAPIFYLGNIAEKNIYAASDKKSLKGAVLNSIWLVLFGLIAYFLFVYTFVSQFPNYLPKSIDLELFSDIIIIMFLGYSIFVLFHFPINGVLFKFNLHDSQKYTSYAYIMVLGIFTTLYLLDIIKLNSDDYLLLLSLVISILITLSISKFLLVILLHKKEVFAFLKTSKYADQ